MLTSTTWSQTTGAGSALRSAGQAADIPSRGFSCVYLTASIHAARLASTLAGLVQIDVYGASTLAEAEARLRGAGSRVLLTDAWFERPGWEDVLQMAAHLPFQVAFVLVSRVADKQLWIDALERGVYDLILEPFREDELRHVLEGAHFRATSGGSCQLFGPSLVRSGSSAPPVDEPLLCACS
jgi:DNA-binding response OmpR family regulator